MIFTIEDAIFLRDLRGAVDEEVAITMRIGYWTVLHYDHSGRGGEYYHCRCVCGAERTVSADQIVNEAGRRAKCYHFKPEGWDS